MPSKGFRNPALAQCSSAPMEEREAARMVLKLAYRWLVCLARENHTSDAPRSGRSFYEVDRSAVNCLCGRLARVIISFCGMPGL
eukprot:7840667-Pyramimonas_sp.AAC.1